MQMLASLSNVKTWLNEQNSTNDAQLTRLIGQASAFLLSYLGRPSLFKTSVQEVRDGFGNPQMVLRQWPAISIQSLYNDTQTIPAGALPPSSNNGYVLEPWDGFAPGNMQQLVLRGYNFNNCVDSIVINYTYGYFVTGEAYTIPATPFAITALQDLGTWGRDDGVTINGVAATKIKSGTPATGQYTVAAGVYTFAVADVGKAAVLNYSYIPPDIEQACIEIVGERYRYKGRIGQESVSAGGTITSSYSLKAMQDYTRDLLDLHKRVVPV